MAEQAKAARICMRCLFTLGVVGIAVSGSFAYLSPGFDQLRSLAAAREMLRFLLSFFPPDLSSHFLASTARGMLETLAVSAIGTLCATVVALAGC